MAAPLISLDQLRAYRVKLLEQFPCDEDLVAHITELIEAREREQENDK